MTSAVKVPMAQPPLATYICMYFVDKYICVALAVHGRKSLDGVQRGVLAAEERGTGAAQRDAKTASGRTATFGGKMGRAGILRVIDDRSLDPLIKRKSKTSWRPVRCMHHRSPRSRAFSADRSTKHRLIQVIWIYWYRLYMYAYQGTGSHIQGVFSWSSIVL